MVPCHHLGFEVLLVWYHALRSQSLALKLVELLVLLVWWCWIVAQSLLVVCVCACCPVGLVFCAHAVFCGQVCELPEGFKSKCRCSLDVGLLICW